MKASVANRSMFAKLAIFALVMFGFGFAMVPFYKAICEATGINNFLQRDEPLNSQIDTSRWVTVEFDANTRGLPWSFAPQQRSVRVHPGELVQVVYEVRNQSRQPDRRSGDSELRAESRGRSISARWNASASRSRSCSAGETRAHAGGVRGRSRVAEGSRHGDACRTRFSS